MKKKLLSCLFLIIATLLFSISCSNSPKGSGSNITESPDWACGIWVVDYFNNDMTQGEAQNYLDIHPEGDFIITKNSYGTNGWSIKWGESKKFYEADNVTLNCTSYLSIVKSADGIFKWKVFEDMAKDSDYTVTHLITNQNGTFYYALSGAEERDAYKAFRFDLPAEM